MRNQTYDFILATKQAERDAAIAAIPEFETLTVDVPKLDAKGKPIIEDGFLVLTTKKVLRREFVRAQWADKLKPHEELAHNNW